MPDPHADALPSWNDTPTRAAVIDFVQSVTDEGAPTFVPVQERVAVFDNDGTLWPEHPIPIQLVYTLVRMKALAEQDESLREIQPWKAAWEDDHDWLMGALLAHYHGDDTGLGLLMGAVPKAFEAMTIEEYAGDVRAFFDHGEHPTLGRAYRDCGYAPMIELLRYLETHGFSTWIASGGDRDFMRAVAWGIYGIPPERVIGSSFELDYREREDGTDVLYKAAMDFFDDGPTKPVRIWSRIGRRPILACGNSNGDVPMLRFAKLGERPVLRLLVNHDDTGREFAYDKGAEDALARAAERDWTVVSVANDWNRVFADVPVLA